MPVIADMRKSEFRNRQFVYAEIVNKGFFPDTKLIAHGTKPEQAEGRVVKMHKETVKRLRSMNPWRRGLILMTLYHDRPEVFPKSNGMIKV
jgi:hypothetical protein